MTLLLMLGMFVLGGIAGYFGHAAIGREVLATKKELFDWKTRLEDTIGKDEARARAAIITTLSDIRSKL